MKRKKRIKRTNYDNRSKTRNRKKCLQTREFDWMVDRRHGSVSLCEAFIISTHIHTHTQSAPKSNCANATPLWRQRKREKEAKRASEQQSERDWWRKPRLKFNTYSLLNLALNMKLFAFHFRSHWCCLRVFIIVLPLLFLRYIQIILRWWCELVLRSSRH